MLGTVSAVINFFTSSHKRTQALEDEIKERSPESQKTCLRTLCLTRWVEKHDSVETVSEFLPHIAEVFGNLKFDKDLETSSKASQLLSAIEKSEFLIALQTFNDVNSPIVTLSRTLQQPELQLKSACAHIDHIIMIFVKRREDETSFYEVFKRAEEKACELGIKLEIPRICGRQKHRSNVPIKSKAPLEFFRATIYYPFLDYRISSLTTRFKGEFLKILPLEELIPAYSAGVMIEEIVLAAKVYKEAFPSHNETVLKNEILLWHNHCKSDPFKSVETATDALKIIKSAHSSSFFPNVTTLLQIFATIPVTSATAERSFTVLKRLKIYLRVNMSENRLTGLALGNVHKEIETDIEEITDLFCKSKPRRLESLDWSIED
ncbi:52 kDa repressor of the inhibitor of the protein kinase isoform X1 [Eurosta solidaginis]|uniref:52 kDa repressor of the inhibitor of the protein kinase isoform X1 n=1 Tax=Eurosta solidaginis TaxID=178769 RepID=UPI003530EAC8